MANTTAANVTSDAAICVNPNGSCNVIGKAMAPTTGTLTVSIGATEAGKHGEANLHRRCRSSSLDQEDGIRSSAIRAPVEV